ncbi:MAG TPA: hypothetical protein PK042_02020 [Usitatibacteraceae bacterium]|nr:hypothetical protein [Usitatibacteraceae bacterium]
MKDLDRNDVPAVSGGSFPDDNGSLPPFPQPGDYPKWPFHEPIPVPVAPLPDDLVK